MKKLILSLILALVTSLTQAQEAPRGVSQIIVTNASPALENLKLVSGVILSGKYKIEQKDAESGLITTGVIALEKSALKIKLNIYCYNKKIIVTGFLYNPLTPNEAEELIVNRGDKDSPYLLGFNKMHEIAVKFGGKRSYN